jgi:spermidine synthase
MTPWELIDVASVPGDQTELRLLRRGSEFSIRIGQNELMNSRLGGSEEMLATIACDRLSPSSPPVILIGGLGMGFTLRAALAHVQPESQIEVAELVPGVIAWAKGPLADIFQGSLEDPRVTLCQTDVSDLLRSGISRYDAVLLDVDNGPDGLTRKANDHIYSEKGLLAARSALRKDGILAVWSSEPSSAFTKRLRLSGFQVDEFRVRANGKRGGLRHHIWIGRC